MNDAVFIFTFSPVQGFIAEARRLSDLYAGSGILVQLANAVIETLRTRGEMIYPATATSTDAPNVIVALVPFESVSDESGPDQLGALVTQALQNKWQTLGHVAWMRLHRERLPQTDETWRRIWKRQTADFWDTAWAAAKITGDDYQLAYRHARAALEATRLARPFTTDPETGFEDGLKDTLSGARAALRTDTDDARQYWSKVRAVIGAGEVRLRANERLDAIGAIKRLGDLGRQRFQSTSDVATADYVAEANLHANDALANYRRAIEATLGARLPAPAADQREAAWPAQYDGDLLYMDGLAPKRLLDEYDTELVEADLREAKKALEALYRAMGHAPSAYYAVLALDGDGMGEAIAACATPQAHQEFSRKLTAFSLSVPETVLKHHGALIYNGGDDVLALAPLSQAVPLAQAFAAKFESFTQKTLSGGAAIVHHNAPLGMALREARQAEHTAKALRDKAAVCVRVLRRSGETVEAITAWKDIGQTLNDMQGHFASGNLAGRFAYTLMAEADTADGLPRDAQAAVLRRLLAQHQKPKLSAPLGYLETPLSEWAGSIEKAHKNGFHMLSRWVSVARFLAQGGQEAE